MNIAVKLKNQYRLIPDSYLSLGHEYDVVAGYSQLHEEARKLGKELQIQPDPDLSSNQYRLFKGATKQEEVDFFKEHFDTLKNNQLDASVEEIINKILTPEIDAAIKSYFQSNYAILWYAVGKFESELDPSKYSAKWHCDGGPSNHLKTITYLDNTLDHGSSTQVMDLTTTQRLKEIGYAYCEIRNRAYDISDLLEQHNLEPELTDVKFAAGDTLLFNPVSLLHKAKQPDTGKTRQTFNLCIVPSPLPWEQVIKMGYVPKFHCIPFEGLPAILGKMAESVGQDSHPGNQVIATDPLCNITDAYTLQHVLELMLGDPEYASAIRENLVEGNNVSTNIPHLLEILEQFLSQQLASTEDLQLVSVYQQKMATLKQFEASLIKSSQTYARDLKPKPEAVMWPIPNHPTHPHNKFDMLPYVNKHPLMDMQTPVATAGSCFAFEIARILQQQGFNYVVSERADNPASGVLVDGYQPGDEYVKFSANFGILFNTPSLLQLAQKAFASRHFNQHLVKVENDLFTDPYRENVFFTSKAAYLEDYPKHIAAIKNTLLNSKVFIFTAGLNECWQMADGTVISRNPKVGFNHLIQHRTLTVAENVEYIKEFYYLVKKHNPDFKLILTLSPVPLLATGRADSHHIIEANTHSKAVLRVALDQVVSELEDAYYLPSYELVTECTESPWIEDHRHVTPDTVNRVVSMFKEMFVKD